MLCPAYAAGVAGCAYHQIINNLLFYTHEFYTHEFHTYEFHTYDF